MAAPPSPPATPTPLDHPPTLAKDTTTTEGMTVPPADRDPEVPKRSTSIESLTSRIDSLLVTYLSRLDAYTIQRDLLSSSLRSGFFSLACANANAAGNLGYGRRYGIERYDDRMKAIKRGCWQSATPAGQHKAFQDDEKQYDQEASSQSERQPLFQVYDHYGDEEENENYVNVHEKSGKLSLAADGITPQKAETSDSSELKTATSSPKTVQDVLLPARSTPKTKAEAAKNPIRQFGILVPQSLRDAQTAFTAAVTSSIPELLNINREMEQIEQDVQRLRESLATAERDIEVRE